MRGRDFLEVAREVLTGRTEAHWRAAAIHAYYALFLECRDTLDLWGVKPQPHHSVHHFVRQKLVFASEPDLKVIGQMVELLAQRRAHASYNLKVSAPFSSDAKARHAIRQATNALALLDAIEADPTRRAAAIASLPP